MLKKFFIAMLGTMAGFWLSIFLLVIGVLVTIGAIAASSFGNSKSLGDNNILHLCLQGEIVERQGDIDVMALLQGDVETSKTLADITAAIYKAADDKSVKGIFLDCKGASMGLASCSEISDAIKAFKKSGKWVVAYSDNYAQADYCIASAADEVCLNPVGMVDVHGLGSTVIFFKNLLDKLGVEVQIVKVGEFKSAVEPFIRTDMSAPSRLQTEVYINQIWGVLSRQIASNRGVAAETVAQWADDMFSTWDPQAYVDQKAVDKLCYRNELLDQLRDKVGVKKDADLPLVTPSEYLGDNEIFAADKNEKHIAVLYAAGDITESDMGGIASDRMVPLILKLKDNKEVAGMVLRVNSPGGSAFASEQIWRALQDFKAAGKPLYVSMGDYAASGGYYISAGADKIYADSTTITGSIGIFGMIPCAQKLLTDKIGLNFQTVQTSKNANFPALYQAGTPEQMAAMQKYVERGYETFVSRVAQGRDISADSVKAIGGGRVWDAISAKQIGLVDEMGSLQDAIAALAQELKMDADKTVAYPEVKDPWLELISSAMGNENGAALDALCDPQMLKALMLAKHIDQMHPVQARMETIIIN